MKAVDVKRIENEVKHLEFLYRKSTSDKEKAYILDDYINLNEFLYEFFNIDIKCPLCISKENYDKHISKVEQKSTEDYLDNIEYNGSLASKVIEMYELNNYYPNLYKKSRINTKGYGEILQDYFNSLGCGVFKLYKSMIDNQKIILSDYTGPGLGGFCLANLVTDNPLIVTLDTKDCLIYDIVAHEMGHAWNFQLYKQRGMYEAYSIFTEFPSILFEDMFVKHLKDANKIDGANYMMGEALDCRILDSLQIDLFNKNKQNNTLIADKGYSVLATFDGIDINERYSYLYDNVGYETGLQTMDGNELYEFNITANSYLVGELIASELIDKYDTKTIMEFVTEFMLKTPYKTYQEMIEEFDLFKSTEGFQKKLNYVSNIKRCI